MTLRRPKVYLTSEQQGAAEAFLEARKAFDTAVSTHANKQTRDAAFQENNDAYAFLWFVAENDSKVVQDMLRSISIYRESY